MPIRSLILSLVITATLPALQLQDLELVSPVTGGRFQAAAAADSKVLNAPGPADMGEDVDGCRHSSGLSEYDFYVVVDPHSYFASLATEWDQRSGRFNGEIKGEVIDWVRKEFGSEREIDRGRAFSNIQQAARAGGQAVPERDTFVIPQNTIPLDKRYRLALSCYERRGARNLTLAKVALTGAWALRSRAQVPITHPALAGGFEEVNRQVSRTIKDGESFDLAKFLKLYSRIVEDDGLTREGFTVASLALFGFQLRDGDLIGARDTITKGLDRLGKDDKPDVLRGLLRDRKKILDDHNRLLSICAERFAFALRGEEVVRQRIPEILLVTAECHRRVGDLERAASWYIALGKLPETQPSMRAELRFQGTTRVLPADRPYHVQLGWIADEALDRLRKAGVANAGEIIGGDSGLLNAIISEGLGTAAYRSPGWVPATGGAQIDCAKVLDIVGKGLMEHAFRLGGWPKSLGELWEREVIRDRNQVNRFHDPAAGKPLVYSEPPGDISHLAPSTVLLATSATVDTAKGPRYGAFLLNTHIVWTEKPPVVGQSLPTP